MLKTSRGTESITRPGKGGVGVDTNGGGDSSDGDGCSGDLDKKFHPRLCTIATLLTSMLGTNSSTDLSTSADCL